MRPSVHGSAAAKRPASNANIAASGHAVGNQTRIRATPSTTRAAILIRRRRSVLNSAPAHSERLGAAVATRGPIGGKLRLVQLDEVLRLAAPAIDGLVEMFGRSWQRGDDVTD